MLPSTFTGQKLYEVWLSHFPFIFFGGPSPCTSIKYMFKKVLGQYSVLEH